jgi:TRAP-type mannitol/chloroaromatic compound transport system permease small subunit
LSAGVLCHNRSHFRRPARRQAKDYPVNALLKLSRCVDAFTERVGQIAPWLVLVVVLVSAGNAIMRYTIGYSSNAFLEIQWYLFGLIFLSCSGYALLRNAHVRIDLISGRLSKRGQAWIDIFGLIFFLMPMAIAILVLSWPVFVNALQANEMSNSPGGLIVWPARLMIPVGFLLLIAQALSELIKRIGFLRGLCPDPGEQADAGSPAEELAQAIKASKGDA